MSRQELSNLDLEDILRQIEIAMLYQGHTRQSLAEAAAVNPNTISNWLSGYTRPQAIKLIQVARALRLRLTLTKGN